MTGGRAPGFCAAGKDIISVSGFLPDLSPFFFPLLSFTFVVLTALTWRFDEQCPLPQQKQYLAFSVGPTSPILSLAPFCAGRAPTSARLLRLYIIVLPSLLLCRRTSSTTSSKRPCLHRPISTNYLTFLLPLTVAKLRLHSAHSHGDITQTALVPKEVTFLWPCVGDMKP